MIAAEGACILDIYFSMNSLRSWPRVTKSAIGLAKFCCYG